MINLACERFFGKNKFWQKVSGQVKLLPDNSVFFSMDKVWDDWHDVVSLIPFPLEKNQTLESEFVKFVAYDLNLKKNQQSKNNRMQKCKTK